MGITNLISLLFMVAVSSLNIGDVAPSLEGTQWLKGDAPVFEDQVTIVEVWRTTCSSCKSQIPHLTSLQQKFGDRLSVVSVSRDSLEVLKNFINENGDQMGYTIGKITDEISDSYMSGVPGVPYTFLVNREGLLIWKGHPSRIDDILARTMEGNIDVKQLKEIAQLEESLTEALNTNQPAIIAPVNQKLLAADPTNEEGLDVGMRLAKYNDEPEKVKEMFDNISMTGLSGYKANLFAMMLVSESDLGYRYPEAALKFSIHALKQEPQNYSYIATYARVLYCLGDVDKAILWQKKAVDLNPSEGSYQASLDYYRSVKNIREKSRYEAMTRLQDSKTGNESNLP